MCDWSLGTHKGIHSIWSVNGCDIGSVAPCRPAPWQPAIRPDLSANSKLGFGCQVWHSEKGRPTGRRSWWWWRRVTLEGRPPGPPWGQLVHRRGRRRGAGGDAGAASIHERTYLSRDCGKLCPRNALSGLWKRLIEATARRRKATS
jgi:hypothetical protein